MRRVLPLSWMTLLVMPMAASAFHGGAPTCHADDILESPMGNPISNMGYTLVATPAQYTPGVAMTLSLVNVDPQMQVRGVLIYVEDPDALDAESKPIKRGNFSGPFPTGIKAVFDGYQGCDFAGQTPVLTHADANPKALPLQLTWQPPAIDTGNLRVRAIALLTFDAYQMLSLDLPSINHIFADSFE
ncbi:MAG: hypothetical protein IPO95_12995 [Rhodanobacteraceae bacterium]|nr:hypothetical protein [Rhodanobacteraceae bacterium]MBL0040345.1 hypothetical protein [Xanthomonadales bacterium]MBP6078646.1 hypothetical protein [Xanthomonadales bacterium]MBP7625170.1 hypothetical protein [Xanthomonadales bacterium]